MANRVVTRASIDVAGAGDAELIPAPGAESRLHILHLDVQNTGTDTTLVTFKDGASPINGGGNQLIAGAVYKMDASLSGDYEDEWVLGPNAAFVLDNSEAQQLSGTVQYIAEPL